MKQMILAACLLSCSAIAFGATSAVDDVTVADAEKAISSIQAGTTATVEKVSVEPSPSEASADQPVVLKLAVESMELRIHGKVTADEVFDQVVALAKNNVSKGLKSVTLTRANATDVKLGIQTLEPLSKDFSEDNEFVISLRKFIADWLVENTSFVANGNS